MSGSVRTTRAEEKSLRRSWEEDMAETDSDLYRRKHRTPAHDA